MAGPLSSSLPTLPISLMTGHVTIRVFFLFPNIDRVIVVLTS